MGLNMKLTKKNYYSNKADQEYMSFSQFKQFNECQAKAMAILNGDYEFEESESMLIGSYVVYFRMFCFKCFKFAI